MPAALPRMSWNPWRLVRERVRRYWIERLPLRDATVLTQRNVYILPTRPGFMLGATLLVLLVASINYQLNLGYLLTFLLAGSALVGMHLCHGTLRGLEMQLQAPDPAFAGSSVALTIHLRNMRRRTRHGIGLAVLGAQPLGLGRRAGPGQRHCACGVPAAAAGLHGIPPLTAEHAFSAGHFPRLDGLAPGSPGAGLSAARARPPPLPPGEPRTGAAPRKHAAGSGEHDGVRAYRRGDPLKLVVWKKAAKADELVSRDTQQAQGLELWLDLAHTGLPAAGARRRRPRPGTRLSRLCAWVVAADRQGLDYGLRLGPRQIPPASGEAHRRHCLEALALLRIGGLSHAGSPAPAAPRRPRHPVPAAGHRHRARAAGGRLPLWCSLLAVAVLVWRGTLAWTARSAALALVAAGPAGADHRRHAVDASHAARAAMPASR
jgi:uncharacterized protein (DUF58 family)